jgi:hypothetical protein
MLTMNLSLKNNAISSCSHSRDWGIKTSLPDARRHGGGSDGFLTDNKKSPSGTSPAFWFNIIMAGFVVIRIYFLCKSTMASLSPSSWGTTEFLVNFHGGFVRRGLLGELLYGLCSATAVDPRVYIVSSCAVCYVIVVVYFVRMFRSSGICWWLLPMSFFLCGLPVIRKDAMVFIIIIMTVRTMSGSSAWWLKALCVNVCVAMILFLHEGFFFSIVPFACLWMLRSGDSRVTLSGRLLSLLPMLLCFAAVAFFKGSYDVAQSIQMSWHQLFPGTFSAAVNHHDTIGSIGWTLAGTLKGHFIENFGPDCLWHFPQGWMVRPFTFFIVYYITTRCLRLFGSVTPYRKRYFSAIYLFQFLSLSPMFIALSCDYGRIFFYLLASTFIITFTFSEDQLADLIPLKCADAMARFDACTDRIIPCSRPLVCLLLLVFGVSECWFCLSSAFNGSVAGSYWQCIGRIITIITR